MKIVNSIYDGGGGAEARLNHCDSNPYQMKVGGC